MWTNVRLTLDQFWAIFDREYTGEYDRIDFQQDHADELFETGSVTVKVGDHRFVICLAVDQVFGLDSNLGEQ